MSIAAAEIFIMRRRPSAGRGKFLMQKGGGKNWNCSGKSTRPDFTTALRSKMVSGERAKTAIADQPKMKSREKAPANDPALKHAKEDRKCRVKTIKTATAPMP